MKKIILLIPIALSLVGSTHAQSIAPATINATGGTNTIGTTELEWSVGEMTLVSTFSSSSIVITQGVLQPSDVIDGIPETKLPGSISVFPNPAAEMVTITGLSGDATFRLLALTGNTIQTGYLKAGDNIVQLRHCATGLYIMEITGSDGNKHFLKLEKQ